MDEKLARLIEGLNRDLNAELNTIIRYIRHASVLKGIAGHEVRELLQKEVPDEVKHAMYLADKIVALGGVPKVEPQVPAEVFEWRAVLEDSLKFELEAIAGYKERAAQAEEVGDIGLKATLEAFAEDETRHKEEIERLLGGPAF
ncbi:bacterioferritin [Thermoflexus sp.]|uniref:ferritin-like domain-containing protein n=1 Tax=Thermoflexus sp. TaxID=1969742 RepID=UPI0025FA906A|nr:ferritin-like domain-containing protein [Thermoflexus sp.]MDW8181619.1 ferritin-like domain-containing protein [Anaerolineae bacterium]MCS6964377.1 ferritin-like domain-containing protein [Thermoflexus sp.]MCS7352158.1 ferritin-like domain-containing protein [Thermoflexus sp.]MCX7689395.1 ferritin-like domain-containing protein [Thermoflexus sp.]MDW8185089.1 ferritin-like domain-containing protein [Anaerolineae bacterium]